MRNIDYSTVFKALNDYADKYNSKAGSLSQRLRQSTISTAQDIIRLYAIVLARHEAKMRRLKILDSPLPSLKTNNVQLAKRLRISTRSVKNHVGKLLNTGVISRKIFHGTKSQYELWINEEIILPQPVVDMELLKKLLREEAEKDRLGKSLPQTDYLNNINNITNNSNVDMLTNNFSKCEQGLAQDQTSSHSEILAPDQKKEQGGLSVTEIGGEHLTGGAGAAELADGAIHFRDQLWDYARGVLYPHVNFSLQGEAKAKIYLTSYFKGVPADKLSKVYAIYVERIELVKKFLNREPHNRFIPLPYHYFDINNKNGFTATARWYKGNLERLKELKKESILKSIIGNYAKACADSKSKDSLFAVYRQCEMDIKSLGCAITLKKFYMQASKVSPILYPKIKK